MLAAKANEEINKIVGFGIDFWIFKIILYFTFSALCNIMYLGATVLILVKFYKFGSPKIERNYLLP